jgi:hypothetical protein
VSGEHGSTFTVFMWHKKLWRIVLRVVSTSECQYHTGLALFTVICVVWRLHVVTWCAQASVLRDTTLAVEVKNNRGVAGAVVMAFNLM